MPAAHPSKKVTPPPGPVPASLLYVSRYQDEVFWKGFRTSAAGHAIGLILMIVLSLTLARTPKKFIPSIRVDLVALPDTKKGDLNKVQQSDFEDLNKKLSEASRAEKQVRENAKKELAKPTPPENTDMALKHDKKVAAKEDKSLKNAIDRIKALAAIEDDDKKSKPAKKVLAKGNQISKGEASTGPVSDTSDAFLGKLQAKVHDNWNLPVWLSKQGFDATVVIFLDRGGYVTNMVMGKSSGNKQFDDYCTKTIRMSQPFGAPPDEVLQGGVTLGFPL